MMLGFVVLLCFLTILPACSNNNDPKPTSEATKTPDTSTPAPTEAATPEPEKRDPVTLTVLTWFVGPNQALFDEFTKMYPWITIEANTNINGGIINNVIAGDKADLVFLDNGLSEWMSGDLLEDLTPYIEKDQRIQNADKVANLLESFQTGGKQWTVPYSDIPMWIVVNEELMNKYGMTMPGNDWTYDDLLEMAKKATNAANNDWGGIGLHQLADIMTMANGSAANWRYMNEDLTASVVNTPAVMDDLKWIQELSTKWNVHPNSEQMKANGIPADPAEAFLNGNILFMIGADWYLEALNKASFEWDVLPMPMGKEKQATIHQAGAISIPKASEHKEEAFLYISFLFDVAAQKKMIENGSGNFVKHPELDGYYDQVDIWKGKNVEGVKQNSDMCCFSSDPRTVELGTLAGNVNGPLAKLLLDGGDLSTIIPHVESYNTKAAETRKALGW